MAARDSAAASSADSAFKSLAAAYAKQEAHKLAKIAKATVRALKKAGHAVARAAKAVAKAACKYSGAQDVVGCVTHPSLAGCAKAALTVALTVGTAGEGEIAEIGLNAAEHAGEDLAENAGEVALDANPVINAVRGGKTADVDKALNGRSPVISPQAFAESTGHGPASEVMDWLTARGGRIGPEANPEGVARLQARAVSLGRVLKDGYGTVADSAIQEGLPIITNDQKFTKFLKVINHPVEGY